MLLLILTYRHKLRLIKQNIGGHQGRVRKQTDIDVFRSLKAFVLELRHTLCLAELRIAIKRPGKLCVRRNMTLHKNRALVRIKSHGQEKRHKIIGAPP